MASHGHKRSFDGEEGKRRAPTLRKIVDYSGPMMRYVVERRYEPELRDSHTLQPERSYGRYLLPPAAYRGNAATGICARLVNVSNNYPRSPIHSLTWMPDAHRLITGSQVGLFTLWNAFSFNFEAMQQAHNSAVRAMVWSHNERWLVTGDHSGYLKYWQPTLNNVKEITGHEGSPVRCISWAPTDTKFASCADDGPIKIWDFETCKLERKLQGHGWDVKCQQWHPSRAIVASGSKDALVKLWDPLSERDVATLHAHKATVTQLRWHANGHWLLTCSRDQLLKLFDIRTMRELRSFKGHKREVTSIAWHPVHDELFASGCYDGAIHSWIVSQPEAASELIGAHHLAVWALAWHPIGHMLVSGSQDGATKFWARNRPGDVVVDREHIRPDFSEAGGAGASGDRAGSAVAKAGPVVGGAMAALLAAARGGSATPAGGAVSQGLPCGIGGAFGALPAGGGGGALGAACMSMPSAQPFK